MASSPNGNQLPLHSTSAPNGPPSGADQDPSGSARTRNTSSTSSNMSVPSASQESFGSSSEKDFDKIGQDEVAEIPRELLADYGTRMAEEVLQQVTTYQDMDVDQQVTTPSNDELPSPLSGYNYPMDERDLYVPHQAGEAEAHPIDGSSSPKKQEHHDQHEDVLAYDSAEIPHIEHNIQDQSIKEEPTAEHQPISAEADLLGLGSVEPVTHPYAGGTDIGHEPSVDELHDLIGSGGGDGNPAAYSNYGFNLDRALGDEGEEQEAEGGGVPESSSITGMRDFHLDEDQGEEEPTYDRKGPLTIPQQHHTSTTEEDVLSQEEVEKMRSHNWPRPPTPPKVLDDEPEEQKPKVVDLSHSGSHPHHLTQKESKTGLHSILKHNGSGEWWSSMDGLNPKVLQLWRSCEGTLTSSSRCRGLYY